MDKQIDHLTESTENSLKWFFLYGFRYARRNTEQTEWDADKFFDEMIADSRRERTLISTAQTDSGHKVTETQIDPDPTPRGAGR